MSEGKQGAQPREDKTVDNVSPSARAGGLQSDTTRTTDEYVHHHESTIQPNGKQGLQTTEESDNEETFHDAEDLTGPHAGPSRQDEDPPTDTTTDHTTPTPQEARTDPGRSDVAAKDTATALPAANDLRQDKSGELADPNQASEVTDGNSEHAEPAKTTAAASHARGASVVSNSSSKSNFPAITRETRSSQPRVAEWSHQKLASQKEMSKEEEEIEWKAMTAIDEFDVYDDNGKLVARGARDDDSDDDPYAHIAGAGKGYTRVLLDEDAQSATSLDEDTEYLFKKPKPPAERIEEEDDFDEDQRDVLSQLQATKQLLTEGQRIAYVGVVRLTIYKMLRALDSVERTKGIKKDFQNSAESMEMWGQQMMVRLYQHMEISSAEQLMIEQLAEHGLEPADLAPPLMQNARVKNPNATTGDASPKVDELSRRTSLSEAPTAVEPPTNGEKDGEEVPEVHGIEEMPQTAQIDLDIRWTVLCDLFLVLIADSIYDARSRRLLERVGSVLQITWIQICRFEKRIIDQLEMDETAKENWDETEHMEDRRKKGLKRKYMVMGLATVGGGLVIGLSAGLLAPMIGAGLVAGFTTIGVGGTATFLGGVGGAALITSAATAAGGTIAIRASNRRTGHVKTFEYRPLHNNKRLNLILTVSGWMTSKVDDVRLPFSTVDPIMGDIYSLLWEPEMLQSMGDTINILATEALTSTVQQVLGSTILVALMASLQLPVVLTKLSYLIDNPWSVSLDRANSAGYILADSLIARHLGQRPITLVGFSLGSRLVFTCLKELADRGAYGIIQNVYLFGSPIIAKKDEWLRARSVIAGRFVNGFATNDWILGYLFRATSGGIGRVAGLASVNDVPGLENMDVTDTVNGHMAYRTAIPKLLRKLNWEVESDEFTEIEDPDPENHAKRQRELIQEIEEARRKAEEKPQKRRFGLFKRGKLAEKQEWEKYKSSDSKKSPSIGSEGPDLFEQNAVLFDIDAIRKELISEQIEVKELDSTQPPMQFTTIKDGKQQTEYLRLPPEMTPEEVAKMKLPPRPDEMDDAPPAAPARSIFQRTKSTPNTPKSLQSQTPPLPPPKDSSDHHEYTFEQPKELVSTLPPLRLTPHIGTNGIIAEHERPDLKRHDTEPAGTASASTSMAGLALGTPVGGYVSPELDRNAWADEEDPAVKMTFE